MTYLCKESKSTYVGKLEAQRQQTQHEKHLQTLETTSQKRDQQSFKERKYPKKETNKSCSILIRKDNGLSDMPEEVPTQLQVEEIPTKK